MLTGTVSVAVAALPAAAFLMGGEEIHHVLTYGSALINVSFMSAAVVVDLADEEAGVPALAGGKAVNLHLLLRAGLPVPPGFCVTTDAYRRAARQAGIDALLDRDDDPATLAERARKALLEVEVPPDVRRAVRDRLTGRPVAVRSSATAEDLPHASFAGQQDTYLNVIGPEAVIDAIRRCWASLWTDRAVAYRAANGIDHRAAWLAVVVQEMVDAEVAGVMFTADPVTGRRRRAVIDAAPGLGEAVVSGAVNPDHFVVDIATGRIVSRRLGDKTTVVLPLPSGGVEHITTDGEGDRACLTDAQVVELARLGGRVEDLYGSPQDTEWAIDADGTLWLTQARPITTLYPIPEGRDGLRVYFCFSVAQGLYRPITPMGASAFRLFASAVATQFGLPPADPRVGPPLLTEAGMRTFLDLTNVARSRVGRAVIPRVFDLMEKRSAVALRSLFDDPRLSVIHRSPLRVARHVLPFLWRHRIPPRLLRFALRPAAAVADMERLVDRLRARLRPPSGLSGTARLDHAETLLGRYAFAALPRIAPVAAAGGLMFALAARLLGDRATTAELLTVLRGMPNNVTTEMDLALWRLAAKAKADEAAAGLILRESPAELAARHRDGTLPPVLRDGLAEFLAAYGHRAVAEIDLGLPRWSEEPEHIFGVVANYLRLEDPDLAPDRLFAKGGAEAERMVEVLAGRVRGLRGRLVRTALTRARMLIGFRELPKFCVVMTLAAAREQITAAGRELAEAGVLRAPEDVSFVTPTEARAGFAGRDLRALVAERRAEYERELRRRRVPRMMLSDGTDLEALAHAVPADGALTGTPASPGTVTGRARVVLDPVGAHLKPGEILVCPSTDPGWTPLFLTAGGLVMEMGGANSHGAVVAREYGIPAVVGVPHATERIDDGDEITVDGTSGVVRTA